jgi:N-acetylglucosaminyl-diphospho-decaprenol L-rhamnosyltransferase
MQSVHVIIVNWNSGIQLRAALRSLAEADRAGLRLYVTVVDNASSDDPLTWLAELPLEIRLLRNSENRGFAAACNQGARGLPADMLLFLNPDTRIEQQTLQQAVAALEQRRQDKVGIVGVQQVDAQGRIARSCARFPTTTRLLQQAVGLSRLAPRHFPGVAMADWDHGESRVVDHVIGSFYLIWAELFESLDGFDPGFFVYLEDLDLSLRARQAGWSCFYLTDVRIYHEGGGASQRAKAFRLYQSLRSRLRYAHKHFGLGPALTVLAATTSAEFVLRLSAALLLDGETPLRDVIRGYRLLWAELLARRQFPGAE